MNKPSIEDWSKSLKILIEDVIDDITGEYSEEQYEIDYKKLVDFIQSLLERERKKALEEVEKLFDDEDMCLYNDYGSKGLWDVCYKEWLSKLK